MLFFIRTQAVESYVKLHLGLLKDLRTFQF